MTMLPWDQPEEEDDELLDAPEPPGVPSPVDIVGNWLREEPTEPATAPEAVTATLGAEGPLPSEGAGPTPETPDVGGITVTLGGAPPAPSAAAAGAQPTGRQTPFEAGTPVRPLSKLRIEDMTDAERQHYFPFPYAGLGGGEQAARNAVQLMGFNPRAGNPIVQMIMKALPEMYEGLSDIERAKGGTEDVDIGALLNRVSQGKLSAVDDPQAVLASLAGSELFTGDAGPEQFQKVATSLLGSKVSPFLRQQLGETIKSTVQDYRSQAGEDMNRGVAEFALSRLGVPATRSSRMQLQSVQAPSPLRGRSEGEPPPPGDGVEGYRPIVERYFGDLGPDVVENMLRIMELESSGRPTAHNQRGEDSRGPLQINVSEKANPQYRDLDLFDPETNIRVAREIFDRQGYRAWYNAARQLGLVS